MDTPTHNLATQRVPINTLHPHQDNPRNGDTDAIAESLTTNGQYRPIVTTTDGTILAGNHTYAAAMELGWEQIDVVTLDLDPNSQEALRIMLADNRTGDLGRYDNGLLAGLLASFDTNLTGTGYNQHAVERIINRANSADTLLDELKLPDTNPTYIYPEQDKHNGLPWAFTPEQRATVLAAVKKAQAAHSIDQAAALTLICEEYQ